MTDEHTATDQLSAFRRTASTDPTPQQLRVGRYVYLHSKEHGAAPTIRQIGKELGLSAPTVHEHVRGLAGKGLLQLQPGIARGMSFTKKGRAFFCDHEASPLQKLLISWGEASKLERRQFLVKVNES